MGIFGSVIHSWDILGQRPRRETTLLTPYHGLTSVALGRCPYREVGTFTPFQPCWIGDLSFYHDGVGTVFIPALTHGAFCGTG